MPNDPGRSVPGLLDVAGRYLAESDIADASLDQERDAILRSWPRPRAAATPPVPQRLPACDYLAAALALATAGPASHLADALTPLLAGLRWGYGYPVHPQWPDLAARVAFAQIIGRRGLMDDDRIHLGLTLMAPRTHYPLHAHPAIELYLVLAGTAGWRVEGAPFAPQPPGSLILHTSGIGHAMQTDADPLLAFYVWRGDLETAPVYIDEAA
jgi:hypothetical protein